MRMPLVPSSIVVALLLLRAVAQAQPAPDPEQPYLQPPPPQAAPGQPLPPEQAAPSTSPSNSYPPAPGQVAPADSSYPGAPVGQADPYTDPAPAPPPAPAPSNPPPAYNPPPPTQHQASSPAYDPYAPPPRPAPEEPPEGDGGFDMPPFSIRLDPLDLLLEGRFGLELEVGVLDFMTVELIPMFFITESPVVLNVFSFVGRDGEITQHSNGLGGLVGASLGVGFWLSGEAFRGYVVRAVLTNYGVLYRSTFDNILVDRVEYTERYFQVLFGSATRFGPFILSSAFGLGYQLNGLERCDPQGNGPGVVLGPGGCKDVQILVESETSVGVASLVGFLHPFTLVGRLSLGVAFD